MKLTATIICPQNGGPFPSQVHVKIGEENNFSVRHINGQDSICAPRRACTSHWTFPSFYRPQTPVTAEGCPGQQPINVDAPIATTLSHSTLEESYMPPAEPQQLKVAPATWALLGLRHVQVYAVTVVNSPKTRPPIKLKSMVEIFCWIQKFNGSGSVDPACRKHSPIYTLW
ncbi:hypothetical protein PILCRDRAFT_824913 [Piloderma croceum F 1598]|uniref:Uncharacterized protein n=1 Tax=Piloderma croceum (strain F 1598) TaxID=765440 RepID=A0A0C3EZE8_PILCF|nr:hypothetical protein PILCRDRAFT_824913 [Piloderma croceum F 1598]